MKKPIRREYCIVGSASLFITVLLLIGTIGYVFFPLPKEKISTGEWIGYQLFGLLMLYVPYVVYRDHKKHDLYWCSALFLLVSGILSIIMAIIDRVFLGEFLYHHPSYDWITIGISILALVAFTVVTHYLVTRTAWPPLQSMRRIGWYFLLAAFLSLIVMMILLVIDVIATPNYFDFAQSVTPNITYNASLRIPVMLSVIIAVLTFFLGITLVIGTYVVQAVNYFRGRT